MVPATYPKYAIYTAKRKHPFLWPHWIACFPNTNVISHWVYVHRELKSCWTFRKHQAQESGLIVRPSPYVHTGKQGNMLRRVNRIIPKMYRVTFHTFFYDFDVNWNPLFLQIRLVCLLYRKPVDQKNRFLQLGYSSITSISPKSKNLINDCMRFQ